MSERMTAVRQAAELAEQQAAFSTSLGQNERCALFHVDDGVERYRAYCQQAAELLRSAEALLSEGRPQAQDKSREWWAANGTPSAAQQFDESNVELEQTGPTEFGGVDVNKSSDCCDPDGGCCG